jgi:hypothetical protein
MASWLSFAVFAFMMFFLSFGPSGLDLGPSTLSREFQVLRGYKKLTYVGARV